MKLSFFNQSNDHLGDNEKSGNKRAAMSRTDKKSALGVEPGLCRVAGMSPANQGGKNGVGISVPSAGAIRYGDESSLFTIHAGSATYAFRMLEHGHLAHLYWGAALSSGDVSGLPVERGRAFSPNPISGRPDFSLDSTPLEYPAYGNSDFRSPAIEVLHHATGSRILDLRYGHHRIFAGKPALEGLPCTYGNSDSGAETVIVTLRDEALGLEVELSYTAFAGHPVITRSARIVNRGEGAVSLRRALSCSLDFPSHYARFHFSHLHGAWARETHLAAHPLHPGMQSIESRRGTSSHNHNPFLAFTELDRNEDYGVAYGVALVYSGNFFAGVELDSYRAARMQAGINPHDFCWNLEPGEAFQTPEAVMVFSRDGLGGMSRALHRFYRKHLLPRDWRDRPRPVVINNWEATYFQFDAERIERIAESAADLGVDLLVLDDGWFGKRDAETSSLGDWEPHRGKLPAGLDDLAARINRHGLAFGLWVEPEMVSPDSDLYRAHPDWCLHVPAHARTEGRNQLILDLSRPEVCEEIYRRVSAALRSAPITFVKWDMNRNMTEIGSAGLPPHRQQETAHRYMLGLYGLMARFRREFPDILFEACSGGGGRFDPGILAYFPQVWTSDNSDAIARLGIQGGASVAYPLSTLSAHVSCCPNHQVGRITPLKTRGTVALTGAFGYELDPATLNAEEREEVRRQIRDYKRFRALIMGGDLYRLSSEAPGGDAAWMVVSPDRTEALVTHVGILSTANPPLARLVLRGLVLDRMYRINGGAQSHQGDFLMQVGLPIPEPTGDFIAHRWHLQSN